MSSAGEQVVWGWETFFDDLLGFLRVAERHFGTANHAYARHIVERLNTCIRSLSNLKDHLNGAMATRTNSTQGEEGVIHHFSMQITELTECVRSIANKWEEYVEQFDSLRMVDAYHAPTVPSIGPGRPRFQITQDQLEYLASLSFTWTEIASLLNVSRMTIYRRRQEYGLLNTPTTNITDDELQAIIHQMHSQLPEMGESIVWGRLRSMGYIVTRQRVRRAIHSTDPISVALRWGGGLVYRRTYSVPGPNSLWHIGKQLLLK